MMTNGRHESAKIFEFPVGRRAGAARQRAEAEVAPAGERGNVITGPRSWMVYEPVVEFACGASYHEMAIKEAMSAAGH